MPTFSSTLEKGSVGVEKELIFSNGPYRPQELVLSWLCRKTVPVLLRTFKDLPEDLYWQQQQSAVSFFLVSCFSILLPRLNQTYRLFVLPPANESSSDSFSDMYALYAKQFVILHFPRIQTLKTCDFITMCSLGNVSQVIDSSVSQFSFNQWPNQCTKSNSLYSEWLAAELWSNLRHAARKIDPRPIRGKKIQIFISIPETGLKHGTVLK